MFKNLQKGLSYGLQRSSGLKTLTESKNLNLNVVVTEAEKIVGYPTSFLNLRWLLTDELANVALHFRKIIGTNHPILETARKLLFSNNAPAWGLIILLISKSAGLNLSFSDKEKDSSAGVLYSQRALAEVTEMIRTSNLLHKSLMSISDGDAENFLEVNFGNKIALLSGDYLLSRSFHELACLRNQSLNELMSSALRDLAEVEFIGLHDKHDVPLPSRPLLQEKPVEIKDEFSTKPYNAKSAVGHPRAEWTLRNILRGGSLLGKSCQCALKLGGHTEDTQRVGFVFGKNLALAWQAQNEYEEFILGNFGEHSLMSAPVMLHLEKDPSLYEKIERGLQNALDIDYDDLKKTIEDDCGLEKTKELQRDLSLNSLRFLNHFPVSDARNALENIITTSML